MERRSFLRGILAAGMAPAVVKAGILMPIKKIITQDVWYPTAGLNRGLIDRSSVTVSSIEFDWILTPFTNEENSQLLDSAVTGETFKHRETATRIVLCEAEDLSKVKMPSSKDYVPGTTVIIVEQQTGYMNRYEFKQVS